MQKSEFYENVNFYNISYMINREISEGWMVVFIIHEDRNWLVIYQKQDLIPQ